MQTTPRHQEELTEPALSPAEAARRLGVSRQTVYSLLDNGELRGFRVGSARRIKASHLESYIQERINDGS